MCRLYSLKLTSEVFEMKLIEKIRKNLFFRAIREFVLRFFTDGVGRSGAELAYFFLLSFFPLMIFASLLIGTFNININTVQSLLKGVIPSDVLNIALNYISYFTELQMDGLMYVGLGAALWSASRAVSSLSVAVNRAYRIEDGRNFIVQFLINIGFSAAMLVSIVLTIVILILGRGVLQYISKIVDIGSVQINAWHILRFVPITLLFFCILLFLYSVVPNKRIAFRQVIPGAIAAAISWLVTSIGFSFYVENMARYSLLYGSIGAVIVLMLWLYLTGVILIMGAELNHVLYIVREQQDRVSLFDSTQPLPRLAEEEHHRKTEDPPRALSSGKHEKQAEHKKPRKRKKLSKSQD